MARNRSLDGARGLAALAVALGHCITHTYGLALYPLTVSDFPNMAGWQIAVRWVMSVFNADAAVVLFFILSGHVLSRSLERTSPGFDYFVRRIFRLLPVGIVAAAPFVLYLRPDALDALGTALLVNHSVNGVIWSLQVELVGSALVFALAMMGGRAAALAVAVALLGAAVYLGNWLLLFLPAFCLGFLIPAVPVTCARSRAVLAGSLIVLLFADIVIGRNVTLRVVQAVAAFTLVAGLNARPVAFLESRPVQFLGDVSYPFYLLHPFFMMIFAVHTAPESLLGCVTLTTTSVAAALAMSLMVHVAIEKPAIKAGSALLRGYRGRLAQM